MSIEAYRVYILAIVAVLLILAISWYSWRQFQKTRHQQHLHNVIGGLGLEHIRDVVLPDGLDGLVFIDYLLLTPKGVVVIDLMHSDGHLFGGTSIDQWSQVINNRTYKFPNPLYANETKCQAVMWNVEKIRKQQQSQPDDDWHTHGWVVFSNAGNFPKGIPDRVCMIDDLADMLTPLMQPSAAINKSTRRIWDHLHNLSVTSRAGLVR